MSRYEQYFLSQAGSGIGHVYAGAPHQRGFGIGTWFRGVLRAVYPLLRSAGSSLLGEVGRAGSNVLSDVLAGQARFGESFKQHMETAGDNVRSSLARTSEKLAGNGIKRKRLGQAAQSQRGRRAVKKLRTYSDIFGKKK